MSGRPDPEYLGHDRAGLVKLPVPYYQGELRRLFKYRAPTCWIKRPPRRDSVEGVERNDLKIFFPTPSLVQHIGDVSTLWPAGRAWLERKADRFAGDPVQPED